MKRIVLFTLVTILLAVGIADASGVFHPPVLVNDGEVPWPGNSSPDVTVDGTGTLYVVWVDTRIPPSSDAAIYFSYSDDGVNWSKNVLANNDPGNQYMPSVAQCAGVLVTAWHSNEGVFTASSFDGGETWTGAVHLDPDYSGEQWAPELAAGPDCTFHIVWTQLVFGRGSRVHYSNSNDGGLTWSPAVTVSSLGAVPINQWGHRVVVDEVGGIHVVWRDIRNTGGSGPDIFYSYSSDGGQTWLPDEQVNEEIEGAGHWGASIAVGELEIGTGTVFVGWADDRTGDKDPYVSWRTSSGWSEDRVVTPNGAGTNETDVELAVTNGELVVGWLHDWYGGRELRVGKSQSGYTWSDWSETVADTGWIMGGDLVARDGRVTWVYSKHESPSYKIFATSGQMVQPREQLWEFPLSVYCAPEDPYYPDEGIRYAYLYRVDWDNLSLPYGGVVDDDVWHQAPALGGITVTLTSDWPLGAPGGDWGDTFKLVSNARPGEEMRMWSDSPTAVITTTEEMDLVLFREWTPTGVHQATVRYHDQTGSIPDVDCDGVVDQKDLDLVTTFVNKGQVFDLDGDADTDGEDVQIVADYIAAQSLHIFYLPLILK